MSCMRPHATVDFEAVHLMQFLSSLFAVPTLMLHRLESCIGPALQKNGSCRAKGGDWWELVGERWVVEGG